jgi:hypothetical protein
MNVHTPPRREGLIPKPIAGRLRWVERIEPGRKVRVLQQMYLTEYRLRLDGWPVDTVVEWIDVPMEDER